MKSETLIEKRLTEGVDLFLPTLSVDCVIFGFHNKSLKILLSKPEYGEKWMLPGGFVHKDEDTEESAFRILEERTGLQDVYLRQFHVFGKKTRVNIDENKKMLDHYAVKEDIAAWYLGRFISLAYYALIKYQEAELMAEEGMEVAWFDLNEIPTLYGDHNEIVTKALATIRQQIGFIPIGYELLPTAFIMPELRGIYEVILGREIDRRNFQRKILSIGFVYPLNKTRKTGAHKSPHLYAFDKEKYDEAEKNGIQLMTASL